MFSRDKRDDSAASRRPPGPPEPEDASLGSQQPGGGFFNLPTSPPAQSQDASSALFSGMAVAPPEPVDVEPVPDSVTSGFSFLHSSASAEEPNEPEPAGSGFSFMASGDDHDEHADHIGSHADAVSVSSGFGFIQAEVAETGERSISPASSTTSFSFMQEQAAATNQPAGSGSYLQSMSGLQAAQEIHLGATAVARKVKKKKSTKKVGYAREEAEQELQEDLRSAHQTPASAPAPTLEVVHEQPPPLPRKPSPVPVPASVDQDTPPPLPPKNRAPAPTPNPAPAPTPVPAGGSMFADMDVVSHAAPATTPAPAPVHHELPKPQVTPDRHEHEVQRRPSTSSTTSSTSTGAKKSAVGGFFSSWFGGGKKEDPEPEPELTPAPARHAPASRVIEQPQLVHSSSSSSSSAAATSQVHSRATAAAAHQPNEHSSSRVPSAAETRREPERSLRREAPVPAPVPAPTPAPALAPAPAPVPGPAAAATSTSSPKRIPEPESASSPKSATSSRANAVSPKPARPTDPIQALEEEIAALMFDFHQHTAMLCNDLKEVHSRQQALVRETETLQSEQSRFQKQLHEKEIEQQRLAEAEEFEQADALSGVIETLKRQTNSRAESLRSLVQEAAILDRRREELVQEQVTSLDKVMGTLRQLQAQHKKLYDKLVKESTEQFNTREQMLAAEQSRIEMTRGHIARDEQNFNEERDQIEEVIAAQTTAATAAKAELDARRVILEDEIEELRQLLAAKEAERDEVLYKLQEEDSKIQVVRTKFDRQLNRLKEREDMINRSKSDCEADAAALQAKQNEYQQERDAVDAKKQRMLSASEQWLAELALTEQVKALLAVKTAELSSSPAQHDHSHEEKVLELKASIADAEETVHDLQRQHQRTQQQIETLSDELRQITEQLPQLEANKKAAAAARKFKDAAAINQEIKDATTRRDEIQAQLEELSSRTEQLLNELEAARAEQEERRGKLLEAQKDADVRRFEELLARSKQLRKLRAAIDSSKASRLQLSAAVLLDAELAAADAEAEEIRLKHNLTFDQLEDDEDDDEDDAQQADGAAQEAHATEETQEGGAADQTPEAAAVAEAADESAELSEEVIQEARELHAKLTELEAALDEAAANEDFEKAAELDEQIADLSAKFVALNVPPELLTAKPANQTEDTDGATQVDSPNAEKEEEANAEPEEPDAELHEGGDDSSAAKTEQLREQEPEAQASADAEES